MNRIYYKAGYKYVLAETYVIQTTIMRYQVGNDFLRLTADGTLIVQRGYAWDGASGPTVDTSTSMRGSLVHDALYQLEREGLIGQGERKLADRMLRDICLEDGMAPWRAWLWYKAVRLFGGPAADPDIAHPPEVAPK